MRLLQARRDDWVVTRKLILKPAARPDRGDIRGYPRLRSCLISEIRRPFFESPTGHNRKVTRECLTGASRLEMSPFPAVSLLCRDSELNQLRRHGRAVQVEPAAGNIWDEPRDRLDGTQ
jgi:hypothetical protein